MADQNETIGSPGLLKPDHFPDYLVRDPGEIMLMLKRMKQHRVLLNVHIEGGTYRFVSAVLDCGPGGLLLDVSPDEWLNTHAIAAEFLTCSAQLQGVRVQFELRNVASTTYDALPALFAPPPESMLRLQRRETFRMSVPMSNPVLCQITVYPAADSEENPSGTNGKPPAPVVVRPRVADISMNGVAIVFEADALPVSVGMELTDCLISLPESESAKVRLKVRNLHQTTNPKGGRSVRAGCEIVDMPGRFAVLIQRYIFKIERDRRLMEGAD
jgi:c-di-GMP-binding flagellar brake protein YcgR